MRHAFPRMALAAAWASVLSGALPAPSARAASASVVRTDEIPATNAGTGAKTMTLTEAIGKAVSGSTSVLKSAQDRELAGEQVVQSYLQFLPNLTAQTGYGYVNGTNYYTTAGAFLATGLNYGPSYQVSTTLNLFNGFSDLASWKSAHLRQRASEHSVFRAKQQIALDVAQAFLQVALDNRLIRIARDNLKDSIDRQRLLEEQTLVGTKSKSDLFRQQAQTSADESFLVTNENKQKTDLISLLRKLRIDPGEAWAVLEPTLEQRADSARQAGVIPQDEGEMIRTALEHRRDYDVARANSEATKWDVRSARATYWPRLDFIATYGGVARHLESATVNGNNAVPARQNSFSDQLENQTAFTYGLYLTWSIFDRGVTPLNVERSRAASYKADLDSEDFRHQLVGEVRQAYDGILAASKKLTASEKGLTAARKAYEVSKGKYEVGSLNFIDLASTQLALLQAEAARAQALIDFELQRRSVEYALGTLNVD